ncbi:MAG: hypothetical protein JWN46_2900 [Acidimicrobiales bacterium]|nr:hypothetical protein [Acidimicrobiales bacterium]
MAFNRKLLNDNEELILDLRPHWIAMALPSLALAAAVILGIAVLAVGPTGNVGQALRIFSALLVLVTLVWFGARYLKWNSTNFVLTGDRILTRRGVLSKEGTEIPLDRVNTVFFRQSLFERMVGAGDITIESASERGNETFADIRKPSIVQKEIYVQMESNENRKYDRMHRAGSVPGGPPAPGPAPYTSPADDTTRAFAPTGAHLSIPEQIEKLAEMHQRGLLTNEEYTAKKAELLDRM